MPSPPRGIVGGTRHDRAAGVIWGWKLGAVYAITGVMLGAIASYYVGGFLGEGLLEKFGSAGHAVRRRSKTPALPRC